MLTITIVLLRKMHLQFLPDLWILCHFFQALRLKRTGLFMGKKQGSRVMKLKLYWRIQSKPHSDKKYEF